MSSLTPEAPESTPLNPRAFLSDMDLSAIRERAAIRHPSCYELAQAWDDRSFLLDYLESVSSILNRYFEEDPNSGYSS